MSSYKRVKARRARAQFQEYEYWLRRARQSQHREQRQRLISKALWHLDEYFRAEEDLVQS